MTAGIGRRESPGEIFGLYPERSDKLSMQIWLTVNYLEMIAGLSTSNTVVGMFACNGLDQPKESQSLTITQLTKV